MTFRPFWASWLAWRALTVFMVEPSESRTGTTWGALGRQDVWELALGREKPPM